MSTVQEQITAALKKLGPSAPRVIADEIGTEPGIVGYHVKAMLEAKTIKAAGKTANRVIALPDQKIENAPSAPPLRRGARKKKKGKRAGKKNKKPAPHSPRPAVKSDLFIPALAADMRLVCINGGDAAPVIFSSAQTERIATLLLQHFKA